MMGLPKTQSDAMADTRLTRIESKVDKIAEAFVALARVEEKLISYMKETTAIAKYTKEIASDLKEHIKEEDVRVRRVEELANKNGFFRENARGIAFTALAAVMAGLSRLIF